MTATMDIRISGAIDRIDEAIDAHSAGTLAPLSLKILVQLRAELQKMLGAVQSRDYTPTYPRFLLDWPGDEEFVQEMIKLAYDFKRKVA